MYKRKSCVIAVNASFCVLFSFRKIVQFEIWNKTFFPQFAFFDFLAYVNIIPQTVVINRIYCLRFGFLFCQIAQRIKACTRFTTYSLNLVIFLNDLF